ncbi:MAG: ABC transporter ATP-binding protein [Actinomycetota bacterium]
MEQHQSVRVRKGGVDSVAGGTDTRSSGAAGALDVEAVRVRFRGLVALDDVDLHVDAGEIVGLVGSNGAGKTTLFNVITGLQPAEAGSVRFDHTDISHYPAYRRARLGIARTFQRMNLVEQLSVLDNIMLGLELHQGFLAASGLAPPRGRDERRSAINRVEHVVAMLGLDAEVRLRADELPTGKRRLVEVGRALASSPRLLLLDEPSAGLDEHEARRFAEVVRDWVAQEGSGVVIIEHDIELVAALVDRICVLDQGRLLLQGRPDEVLFHPEVRRAFIGGVTVG